MIISDVHNELLAAGIPVAHVWQTGTDTVADDIQIEFAREATRQQRRDGEAVRQSYTAERLAVEEADGRKRRKIQQVAPEHEIAKAVADIADVLSDAAFLASLDHVKRKKWQRAQTLLAKVRAADS